MVDSKEVLGPLDHILAISVDDFKTICRTCLSSGKLSNIMDTKLDGVHLLDIIRLPFLQVRTIILIIISLIILSSPGPRVIHIQV